MIHDENPGKHVVNSTGLRLIVEFGIFNTLSLFCFLPRSSNVLSLKHIANRRPPLHLLIGKTLKHQPSGAHRDAHLERPTRVWQDHSSCR